MAKKTGLVPKEVIQLENIFCLFMEFCPNGLACFFGDTKYPDTDELFSMISAKYAPNENIGPVDGGKDIPQQQSIVEACESVTNVISLVGGLDEIKKVFTLYKVELPHNARLLYEMNYIGRSFKYPNVEIFARKNHMTISSLYRKKKSAFLQLAWEVYRRNKYNHFCEKK